MRYELEEAKLCLLKWYAYASFKRF